MCLCWLWAVWRVWVTAEDHLCAADGIGLCVELMGCFSSAPVQRAAARVCNQIAAAGAGACEMLLAADVCSMIEQHVKHPSTTFPMFESQAGIIAGIATHNGLVSVDSVMRILATQQHIWLASCCSGATLRHCTSCTLKMTYCRVCRSTRRFVNSA